MNRVESVIEWKALANSRIGHCSFLNKNLSCEWKIQEKEVEERVKKTKSSISKFSCACSLPNAEKIVIKSKKNLLHLFQDMASLASASRSVEKQAVKWLMKESGEHLETGDLCVECTEEVVPQPIVPRAVIQ